MIEINKIKESNDDIEHIDEVLELSTEAQKYLSSFPWCNKILRGWLAKSWGYMLCVFYFEIEPKPLYGADNFLWIIVGDIPPAYIDIESAHNELEALEAYVYLMEEWINTFRQGKSIENCFPINIEPSEKYANMLSKRMEIVKTNFIPELSKKVD
ncbi:hypothetical protein LJC29_07685 [Bacteroides sp. OttesenSCG-928-N06]|nr:hypothetical protein [Bacteroides sp. OttesenSCG-928-N06]